MFNLAPASLDLTTPQSAIPNFDDVPKEMDIFFKTEAAFLPDGKTFGQLTPEEADLVKEKYRFSPYVPGIYQGITWRGQGSIS
jgi:hypothetical protein